MRITSTELENWGDTRDAQGKLPSLIRKLITNSVDAYMPYIDIPTEDSIWKPGIDGVVKTISNSVLGGPGTYNIECGQNADYKRKFFGDLEKRSDKLTAKTDIIFVFITTRKIQDKNKLIATARQKISKSNLWGDIKVFDADSIEHWLEQDYATIAWMCDVLEKPSDGIYDFDKKWSEWCKSTKIPLDEQIILARENIYENEMNKWLLDDKGLLEVKSNSKIESLLFLLASIQKIANKEKREKIKSKVLIVEDASQWKKIVDNKYSGNLILIPMFGVPDGIATLTDKNYQIYFPLGSTDIFQVNNRIELENINNYLLEPILDKKIEDYRYKNSLHRRFSDGNLLLLQQLLRRDDIPLPKPAWVSEENSEILLFLCMFSSWDNFNPKDIKIIEKILNLSYGEIKRIITCIINIEGTPIQQIGSNIQVTIPELILENLSEYLSIEFFDKLLETTKDVLSEIDKNYDEENNNFLYNLNLSPSKEKYSTQIKSSVSQGLALFANYTGYNDRNASISSKISKMIKKLFENGDYNLWLSMNHYMQSLFEAAPKTMLDQLDRIFENDNYILNKMINNSGTCLGYDCFYAGLLNGLESIAWIPKNLPKVTDVLLKMTENWHENSNYSNSPINSLKKIYCVWSPQTIANIKQKKDIITTVIQQNKYKIAVESLLNNLQYNPNDTMIISNHPQYLRITNPHITKDEVDDFFVFIFNSLLQLVEINHHWNLLIDNYFNLYPLQQHTLIDKLKSINFETYNYEEKLELKKSILSKIKWYDKYGKDKNDTINNLLIDELRSISDSVKFSQKYQEYIPFFDVYYFQDDDKPYIDALEDILASDGIKGILELAKSLKGNKYKFQETMTKLVFSDDSINQLISALGNDRNVDEILCYFIGRYFYDKELYFLDNYWKKTWTNDIQLSILKYFNGALGLWQWIEQHKLDKIYWSEKLLLSNLSSEEFKYAEKKLIKYNPDTLLEFIFYNLKIATNDDILNALFLYKGMDKQPIEHYYIEKLFNKLYENSVDPNILIKLEIKYFEILTFYNKPFPKYLKKELSDPNSSLFSEIISIVFLPDALSQDEIVKIKEQEQSNEQKNIEETLLKFVIKMEGTFIFDEYKNVMPWFENNKQRLIKLNRLKSGMSVIGQIFGRCPKDENDDTWPLMAIRDIIEKEENDNLDWAICVGKYNSIGVRSVTPQSTDMWNAYKEYKQYADVLRYKYYRTADVLDNIAENYRQNAQDDAISYKRRYF